MADLNATFFAFRKRERSGVLLGATAGYLVIALAAFAGFAWLNWAAVMDYINWAGTLNERAMESGGQPSFETMMPPQSVVTLAPAWLLFQVLYYVIAAAYETACLRWLVRGETGGILGFTFGADTWRTYFTYWLWFFLFFGYVILLFLIIGGSSAAIGMSAGESGAGAAVGAVMLGGLLWFLGLIYFAVRFAPAAATSVARRKFAFFEAWTVTKGRFWPLLGSFVLLFLMYFVAYIVISSIAAFAMISGMMGQAGSMNENATPTEMMSMFASPQVWVPLAIIYLIAIVGAFVWLIAMFGVNARAAQLALEEGKIKPAD